MSASDPVDQVEALFPADGPHTAESLLNAGFALEAIVRTLNTATWHASAIPGPDVADKLAGSVEVAVGLLDQLLEQVTGRVNQLAGQPGAYLDVSAPAGATPLDAAAQIELNLQAARAALRMAVTSLKRAHTWTARLAIDGPDGDEQG